LIDYTMSVLKDKELIASFAESVGLDKLDDEVAELLLSDLETKMQEIIQESKKIMRHSKRDVLRTDDISLAMQKLALNDVFGYPSSMVLNHEKHADNQNLWYIKPNVVNLKDLISKPRL